MLPYVPRDRQRDALDAALKPDCRVAVVPYFGIPAVPRAED